MAGASMAKDGDGCRRSCLNSLTLSLWSRPLSNEKWLSSEGIQKRDEFADAFKQNEVLDVDLLVVSCRAVLRKYPEVTPHLPWCYPCYKSFNEKVFPHQFICSSKPCLTFRMKILPFSLPFFV